MTNEEIREIESRMGEYVAYDHTEGSPFGRLIQDLGRCLTEIKATHAREEKESEEAGDLIESGGPINTMLDDDRYTYREGVIPPETTRKVPYARDGESNG